MRWSGHYRKECRFGRYSENPGLGIGIKGEGVGSTDHVAVIVLAMVRTFIWVVLRYIYSWT